jgi:hypothetical protein
MEVQNHGLAFEDEVIFKVTGLRKNDYQKLLEGSYVSSLDIFKDIHSEANYSIKVSKNGKGVGCGDILRFMKHCSETEFIMTVGCWQQATPVRKVYSEVYEFYITPKCYGTIWGGITVEHVKSFVDYVKGIPPGKAEQLKNRSLWKQKRKDIYESCTQGIASIDAKIDSKNQRRVQCSMPLEKMIAAGIPHTKYSQTYKGITLPYEQESGPRQFN